MARRFDPAAVQAAADAQRSALASEAPEPSGNALADLVALVAAAVQADLAPERDALRIAVRALADGLAAAQPGRSVEVRIPPFAAVQCVSGPRHTRGTPPNVVETDPATFVGLACGFVTWDDAVAQARLTASGERADLRAFLPLDLRRAFGGGP